MLLLCITCTGQLVDMRVCMCARVGPEKLRIHPMLVYPICLLV